MKIKKHYLFFVFSLTIIFFFAIYMDLEYIIEPLKISSGDNVKVKETSTSKKVKPDPYKDARVKMVLTQIENRGIEDKATIDAMKKVKRHLFVPRSMMEYAYHDRPLPIGHGQTISQPYIVAYMTEKLHLKDHYKVLEIGTGSAYQAAVLAVISKKVYTIEIVPALGKSAKERLKNLAYKNAKVKVADGYHGWKEYAPFDVIIVTAAAGYIPPPLIKQLKDGGRMIIPVGSPFMMQHLVMVEKKKGKITTRKLLPVRFVPLTRSGN